MRILYLITKSERGGAQSVLRELLVAHKEKGDKVLLVSGSTGYLTEEAVLLGFEIKIISTLGNTFNPLSIFKTFRNLQHIARDFSPDVVSIHSSFAGFIGRLALGRKYPTIFTAHGIAFTQGAPLWRKPIAIVAEFIAARFCKKIIAVSENDRKNIKKFLLLRDEKVVTVYNGVSIEEAVSANKTNSVVFVGRLVPPKQPEVLVRALYILKSKGIELPKISIIGDGAQRSDLEKLIKKLGLSAYVHMMGECDGSLVRKTLRESSVFVLPTLWEGFPMTILEAMAEGCAVLASDVGGISEAVNSDVGLVLPRDSSPKVWAENIEKIFSDKQALQKMGENALIRVKNNFSKEKMIQKTFEVYENVIRK